MSDKHEIDVLVIGGGPAGISSAIWACDLGLSVAVVEAKAEIGGQLSAIHGPISNYPGVNVSNGRELKERFEKSLSAFRAEVFKGARLAEIDFERRTAISDDGRTFAAKAIILATGVRRRKLGVPGEEEFRGRGILESGAGERDSCKGKRVLIVGGGDAALENVQLLGPFAERIYLVHRRGHFTARAEFLRNAQNDPNVEFVLNAAVDQIVGEDKVMSAAVRDLASGEKKIIEIDAVLIRIGVEPNSEIVAGSLDRDHAGYILVDQNCETSVHGIYAVGDVANPISPTIATAVGMGATAVKSAYNLIRGGK